FASRTSRGLPSGSRPICHASRCTYSSTRSSRRCTSRCIVFEDDPTLKARVFETFSTNHSPDSQARCLSDPSCCLPHVSAPAKLKYDNVFRVLIVQFIDAHSMDLRALKKSCIHMARPDGRLVPFETFNLFCRDEGRSRLRESRAELDAARGAR